MVCLPYYLKLLTLFVCIVGGLVGYIISNISLYFYNKSLNNYILRNFIGSMWFIPYLSTYGIIKYPLMLGGVVVKSFDQG
jgi:NADH-ubiquinone oxidoreductase chain 5